MVNMIKIVIAAIVLLTIIGYALLGKNVKRAIIFRSAKTKASESLVLEVVTGIITLATALAYYLRNRPEATWWMGAGIVLLILGGIVQLIARKHLYEDKTFEHRLLSEFSAAQTGIYRKLRYPGKTSTLLLTLGFCLAMGSTWSIAVWAALFLPSTLYRISQEEQTLQDKFGERWMNYQEESKRIIPGIF
ncbi:isoprenylcysteine carboxylmethyltransferase family protein [Candidatus Woesearchaeota archaeon]|nr:isoprenylcysteine carboxylmethyltransferase family protein [Candidatus Woesearchaeota archaeon]